MKIDEIFGATRVADNDPVMGDAPYGMCRLLDGVFYVRERDWLDLMVKMAEHMGLHMTKEDFIQSMH